MQRKIAAELDASAKEFPELAGAFGLLLAYVSYSNHVRSLPQGPGGVGDHHDGPLFESGASRSSDCSTSPPPARDLFQKLLDNRVPVYV